ncbi:MAG TPA: hypothetical protein VGH13_15160 [Xanthobacteraceae bacterium]
MRTVLALGLLLSLGAPAFAGKVHHAKTGQADFRASHAMYPGYVQPRQPIDPNFPPVLMDQTPSPDDPSRRGSG